MSNAGLNGHRSMNKKCPVAVCGCGFLFGYVMMVRVSGLVMVLAWGFGRLVGACHRLGTPWLSLGFSWAQMICES